MRNRKLHCGRLLALALTVIMLCTILLPTVAQAAETALDSYDRTTDIGSSLLPKGEFAAQTPAYRSEMFFKAVKYHQGYYNLTVDAFYRENEKSAEDSLRFVVAKAKDTYKNNAEVMIEIVVTGPFVHIFARQSNGTQETIRDFFRSHGTVGEKNAYAVRYSNRRLWFYENGQKVFANIDLGRYSRYTDVQPYAGLAFQFAAGAYSNLHLWGKGIEYYGDFPSMPEGNGDYAPYVGIKSEQGSSATYENGVLQSANVCADLVSFTKLPFTDSDTYAWSFEVTVDEAAKDFHGLRAILRADESLKNRYQLTMVESRVIVMYNDIEIESAPYKRVLGQPNKVGVVVGPKSVSVWVDDVLVLDNVALEYDLPSHPGVKIELAKLAIRNMHFYYTQKKAFVKPASDPTIPVFTSGMYNGARYMKVMAGNKEAAYSNYTVTRADGLGNKYTFENTSLTGTAAYTMRTSMTINKGFAKPWEGPRIMFRSCKQGDIYIAFCDTRAIVLIGGGNELESCPMPFKVGQTYDVAIESDADKVNVWVNGKLIFNQVALSKTGEKTTAKPGLQLEACDATLADLKIYGKSVVLTNDIFNLELHNNPYFNSVSVPKKPSGNINHFDNVKLNVEKSRAKYMDGTLYVPITSESNSYTFVDQSRTKGLNGLKKTDTFVWHYKIKPQQVSAVELEGAKRQDAGMTFTVKESLHPSESNINYRSTLCLMDNRAELQIWQNSVQIKNFVKKDFTLQQDKEYTVDMLVGPTWMKVWINGALTFTAFDLPEYQLSFTVSATNVRAEMSDIQLYNVEPEKNASVLPVADTGKAKHAGDTLAAVAAQAVPMAKSSWLWVLLVLGCIIPIGGAAVLGVYVIKTVKKTREKSDSEQAEGVTEQ